MLTTVGWPNRPAIAGSGGFLAADVGAGGLAYLQRKVAQFAGFLEACYRAVQCLDGLGILRPAVDETGVGTYGEPGDEHALDEHVGIAFHDHAIDESA